MKIILKNVDITFQKKRNYKYNLGFSDLLPGYIAYYNGIIDEKYQKHTQELTVSEGDTIEYCLIQSSTLLAAVAAFDGSTYKKSDSVQAVDNENTVETMTTRTYVVPAGINKVILSCGSPGGITDAMRAKVYIKVY